MGERCKLIDVIRLSRWVTDSALGIFSDHWSPAFPVSAAFQGCFAAGRPVSSRSTTTVFLTLALTSIINAWRFFLYLGWWGCGNEVHAKVLDFI